MQDLRAGHGQVMGELSRAREEVGNIYKAIETMTSRGGGGGKDLQEDVGKVMAEVKMLHGLVEELTNAADPFSPPDEVTTIAAIGAAATDFDPLSEPMAAPETAWPDDATIVHLVRDGIAKDWVDLVLQPVVSLPQRKRKFYEAYARIRSEDGEVITPSQYIAIAEHEGLVTAIDNLMLFRCVQQLRNKHNKNRNIGFFCNVSPHTLADKKFFNEFVIFMTENSSLAQDLIFEFSHATIANQDDEISHQLGRRAALGFRFSLDQVNSLNLDYGTLAEQHFKYVKSMPRRCCGRCRSRQRISTCTISRKRSNARGSTWWWRRSKPKTFCAISSISMSISDRATCSASPRVQPPPDPFLPM